MLPSRVFIIFYILIKKENILHKPILLPHYQGVSIAYVFTTLSFQVSLSIHRNGSVSVLNGRPMIAYKCFEIHQRTSPISLTLLLQEYPTNLVLLSRMTYEMDGRWQVNCFLVRCYFQERLHATISFLIYVSSFFQSFCQCHLNIIININIIIIIICIVSHQTKPQVLGVLSVKEFKEKHTIKK